MADGAQMVVDRWPIAADLAGLPEQPATVSGVIRRAKKEGWRSRRRVGSKALEYNPDDLPSATAAEWRRRNAIAATRRDPLITRMAIADAITQKVERREFEQGAARYGALTDPRKKARADARLDVLTMLRTYAAAAQLSIYRAVESFVADFNAGQLPVEDHVRAALGETLSAPTLHRWRRAFKKRGAIALAGDYGNREGSGLIDSTPALHDLVVGLIVDKPHVSAKTIHRALCARFSGTETPIPALRSLQRWMVAWKRENAQALTSVSNPDAWKNKYKIALGSASEAIERLNQRWEMDSTPADVMLVDGRHVIVQIVDVWSRRRMFHVSKSSSAEALCQIFRRGLLAWGVPEEVKIDNGQDYVSHRFQRVCSSLGINTNTSAPFSPWEKPHVERGFRTLLHGIFELLPGFIGHNVAEAQAIRAKDAFADRLYKKNATVEIKMTAAELQEFCDRWTRDSYQHEKQEAIGGSPFQRATSWTGDLRTITDERLLDVLLADAPDGTGGRTVVKKGIRVDKLYYGAEELGGMVGERVHVKYDAMDVGRIWVFQGDEFICQAICPEALGISRQELAVAATLRQNEETQEKRRELKAVKRRVHTSDVLAEIQDQKEAEAAKLSHLPMRGTEHTTPAIDAARAAIEAPTPTLPVTADSQVTPDNEEEVVRKRNRRDFVRALDLLMLDATERCDTDAQWLKGFTNTSAFRASWMLFDGFDLALQGLDEKYGVLQTGGALQHRIAEFM